MREGKNMAERDFIAEMRALIDAETAHGPYASPLVAERIVAKLRATDAELLAGWLDVQAESFVRMAINARDCSARTHARLTAKRAAFADAADAHASGDSSGLTPFLSMPFTVAEGTRKPLRDMTAEDLSYSAEHYETRAAENRMNAAFLQALAKKVKRGTVSDHFTEEKIVELWRSITGNAAA